MKRIQNRIAESRKLLPISILYSVVIWLLAGLLQKQWWIQFGCFFISAYLMMLLNNRNLLIRIYSRMVSASFLVLSSAAIFLFPSISGAILQTCLIASLLILFSCYQETDTPDRALYAFLFLSMGSLLDIYVLCFVPICWLLMMYVTYSMSWRSWFGSLIGLLIPYWFLLGWVLYRDQGHLTRLWEYLVTLVTTQELFAFHCLSLQQELFLGLLVFLGLVGNIHFIFTSYLDKIRVRQLYYAFLIVGLTSILLIITLPQHYDLFIRATVIAVSPAIGHFFALTHTKFTNILFLVIVGAILALTAFNLWISSSLF